MRADGRKCNLTSGQRDHIAGQRDHIAGRRDFIAGFAGAGAGALATRVGLTGALASGLAGAGITGAAQPAMAQSDAELLERVARPRILGNQDAPVHVAEYFSMTCGHCARFHKRTFPDIKSKLIDEGHIRFELRPFPLDGTALVAHTLARALPERRYFAIVKLMLDRQSIWARGREPVESLRKLVRVAGVSADEFHAITRNRALLERVVDLREAAIDRWKVNSTPSFVIDNKKFISGGMDYDEFVERIGGIGT